MESYSHKANTMAHSSANIAADTISDAREYALSDNGPADRLSDSCADSLSHASAIAITHTSANACPDSRANAGANYDSTANASTDTLSNDRSRRIQAEQRGLHTQARQPLR